MPLQYWLNASLKKKKKKKKFTVTTETFTQEPIPGGGEVLDISLGGEVHVQPGPYTLTLFKDKNC